MFFTTIIPLPKKKKEKKRKTEYRASAFRKINVFENEVNSMFGGKIRKERRCDTLNKINGKSINMQMIIAQLNVYR